MAMVLHTSTHTRSSVMEDAARVRLPDNSTSVSSIQKVLAAWWKAVGSRDTTSLLRHVLVTWSGRGCPSPTELVADKVFILVSDMVQADPTLHPRRSRIVCALIAEHGKDKRIFSSRKAEFEAMELSSTMLKAFAKYRELVRNPAKMKSVCRGASLEEK